MNKELQRIAERLSSAQMERNGNIYHPLPFREFDRLSTSTNARSAHNKWRLIYQALGEPSRLEQWSILDVGANAGFYAFNFAKLGASVDAFEPHAHYVTIGKDVVNATGLTVNWHNKPLELSDITHASYNVALMLSVFQWMSSGNQHLDEATELLEKIAVRSDNLFFELGCNQGESAIHTDERPIGWLWNLLSNHTNYKNLAYLGTTMAWSGQRRYVFFGTNCDVSSLTLRQKLTTYALRRGLI